MWTFIAQGTLQAYLFVAFLLFLIGLATLLLRRNLLLQFMGIELMLNAINVVLLAFGRYRGNEAQASSLYLFILALAAAEAAVGLGLILALFRHRKNTDADRQDALQQ